MTRFEATSHMQGLDTIKQSIARLGHELRGYAAGLAEQDTGEGVDHRAMLFAALERATAGVKDVAGNVDDAYTISRLSAQQD